MSGHARLRSRWVVLVAGLQLGLSACGSEPTPADPFVPPVEEPEVEDPARLLTDAELQTAPSANELPLDTAWVDWIRTNHEPIRSLTVDDDFSDLAFLQGYVGDRRIVQLGESGHGVAEFNKVKVRLIKYLHEEMGFDVIAFESSIFECHMAGQEVDFLAADALMANCIFRVWHTNEVLPLFEYIKSTQSTARPLRLAGFDSQVSSRGGVQQRAPFFHDVLDSFNPAYADSVFRLDRNFVNGFLLNTSSGGDAFAVAYAALLDSIEARRPEIDAAFPSRPWTGLLARQTAWSTTQFIDQLSVSPEDGSVIRDRAMADNFDVLADSLYAGQKIINWAHNYHIAHNRGSMGRWVHDRHGSELYTIGLYMYQGEAATNNRERYDIPEPDVPGLDAILHRARVKYLFVDLLSRTETAGTSWMFTDIYTRTWGVTPVFLTPRAQYDALVSIHTVHPPSYAF